MPAPLGWRVTKKKKKKQRTVAEREEGVGVPQRHSHDTRGQKPLSFSRRLPPPSGRRCHARGQILNYVGDCQFTRPIVNLRGQMSIHEAKCQFAKPNVNSRGQISIDQRISTAPLRAPPATAARPPLPRTKPNVKIWDPRG